jgi:uncharacterized protein
MPWTVSKSEQCPASRPWAVVKDADGSVEGCHATEADANAQLVALNIAEQDRSKSMDNLERRFLEIADADELAIETRANGQTSIVGYAAVYNRLSLDLGGFREEILPGAFDKILNRQRGKADVVALFNHDNNIVLGRTSSGTLELSSDEKGLRYVVTPPVSRQDVVELISRRDVFGSSFAFTLDRKTGESFRQTEDGKTIRQVREVSGLYDVGPVLVPAYPSSSAAIAQRSYQAWLAEQQEQPAEVAARSLMASVAAAVSSALRIRLRG